MKFTAKTLFALVGAVLALLMLILPFATASAFGMKESISGFKAMFSDSEGLYIAFFIWLAFLAGLAGIVLLFLGKGSKIAGIAFGVCALSELLYIVTFSSQNMSEWGITLSVHAGVGAWLALIFNAAAAVFALLGDKFPFLNKVKVDSVTDKLDSAAASFQKTTGSVAGSIKSAAAKKESVCPSCGAKTTPDSNFCLACGAKLEQPAPEPETPAVRFCPNCGTQIGADSAFCPNCGTKC